MAEQSVKAAQNSAENNENDTVVQVASPPPPFLGHGRRPIYTDVEEITPENVRKVISDALSVHNMNKGEISKLYDIYRGKQEILYRTKDVRPEICNYVVVNRANEIVSFKSSYLLGEPLQYVSSDDGGSADTVKQLTTLNKYMRLEGKAAKDMELANWIHICGVGYRLVLPDSRATDPYGSPFNLYTLNPMDTFVIRYSGVSKHPLAGVSIVHRKTEPDILCVYTPNWYMEFENADLGVTLPEVKAEEVNFVDVPIVEYVHNQARMGAFEVVLSQLDTINTVESNRVDAIEQTVQALMVFENCDVDDQKFADMRRNGAIKIKSTSSVNSKVYSVENNLDQSGVQQTVDDQLAAIYSICGMPPLTGSGASTSDTGAAVMLREGWSHAEARAKETEQYFEASEYKTLNLVLDICRNTRDLSISVTDIKPQFTRRNYADLLTKSQVLTTMLDNPKIAPQLAFESCGMFPDSEAAYQMSLPYIKKAEQASEAQQNPQNGDTGDDGYRATEPGNDNG